MTDAAAPTFQIPRDVIEPIIQAHVSTAIVAALGGKDQIVGAAIARVMNEKVDGDGKKSSYGADTPWLQWAARDVMQKAIRATLEDEFKKHTDAIRTHIVERQAEQITRVPAYVRQGIKMLTRALREHDARSGVSEGTVSDGHSSPPAETPRAPTTAERQALRKADTAAAPDPQESA